MSSLAGTLIHEDHWQRGRVRNVLPVAASLAATALFSFLSGGYILARSAPIAIVYLLLAALWMWFLRRRFWPSPLLLAALVAFGLFVAWTGLSTLWSFGPDSSWVAFDLAAFYLVVTAVVGITPIRPLQLRTCAWGYLAVATAVGVFGLLAKTTPDVVGHDYTSARLYLPVGYWNVLALMLLMGLVVLLAIAGSGRLHPALRAAAAACGVPMVVTFFFTLSRGGWIALAVALLLFFALATSRVASFATLLAVVAPAAAVLWHLRPLSTLFYTVTEPVQRAAEGRVLLRWTVAALIVTVVLQLAVALLQRAVPWPRWSRVAAGAAIAMVLLGAAGVGGWRYLEARGGVDWIGERVRIALAETDTRGSQNQAGRLFSLNTGRPGLWREALEQSRHDRLLGTGAGTFEFTNYRFRDGGGIVRHAHSEWLDVLSEVGVVGLVLFVIAVVLLLAACLGNPFARRDDPLQPLLVALQAGVAAFFVHISWDWDWDMAAVGTVVFLFIAVAASYQRTRRLDERRSAARAAREEAASAAKREAAARATGAEDAESAPAHSDVPELRGASGSRGAKSSWPPRGDASGSTESRSPRPAGAGMWPIRLAASAVLVVLAASWALPYLSAVSEDQSVRYAGKGEPAAALAAARRAARLDPLAASPLLAQSYALQQLGRDTEALAALRAAQRLQPDAFEAFVQEGLLQLKAFDRRAEAVRAFTRALQLNPFNATAKAEIEALGGPR